MTSDFDTEEALSDADATIRKLQAEIELLRGLQATCHCGTALGDHSPSDNHAAVEMEHPCPYKAERDDAREELAIAKRLITDSAYRCRMAWGWCPRNGKGYFWDTMFLGSDIGDAIKAIAEEKNYDQFEGSYQAS